MSRIEVGLKRAGFLKLLNSKKIILLGALAFVLVALSASFFYGWYLDHSKPIAGAGWADQETYLQTTHRLVHSNSSLDIGDLHFAIGYPLLGVLGSIFVPDNPFVVVSLALLLLSATFCFLAVRHLFGTIWALIFSALLFYWDGSARGFQFASELFAIPWNNQVLFLAFSFFFWLLVTRWGKPVSYRLAALVGFVGGLSVLTREESILFVGPVIALHLLCARSNWRKWLVVLATAVLCYVPQVVIKYSIIGTLGESGHDYGYSQTLTQYFDVSRFYENVRGVIIDSDYEQNSIPPTRPALLQAAPWLWVAPIGLIMIFTKRRYPVGLKVFAGISLFLFFFYLSGINMSVQKLAFHCLRYISPSFIVLNLAVLIIAIELWSGIRSLVRHRSAIMSRMGFVSKEKAKTTAVSTREQRLWSVLWLVLDATPILIPTAVAVFGVVVVAFLLLGQFKPLYIWPLGLVFVAVASFVILKNYPRDVTRNWSRQACNMLVLVSVFLWGGYNIFLTSQHLLVNRDPAIYSNAGVWLTKHDDLKIPVSHVFGEVEGLQTNNGSGFKASPKAESQDVLFAQGAHLLPAFIGLAGRIVGIAHVLHLNVLFGVTALMGMYALARALVRQTWWAAVVTGVMAISMPLLYFSRDTYSEPLAATFTLGGLALLWLAIKSKKVALWFLAGLVAGAGMMTRIDGLLTVIGMAAFVSLVLGLSARNERRENLQLSLSFTGGIALTTLLGWLDLYLLSPAYYADLRQQFLKEFAGLIIVVFVGVLFITATWRTEVLKRVATLTKKWQGEAAVLSLLVLVLCLMSRPFWSHPVNRIGRRTYAEFSMQWAGMYIGPALVALGFVGVAVSLVLAFKKKNLFLTAVLVVVLGTSLVYLAHPSIAPDQIWASRRLLPVILPGIAVFGAVALDGLSRQYLEKLRFKYAVGFLVGLILLMTPLVISKPVLKVRSFTQLSAINSMCESLPEKAVVLWVGAQPSQEIVQPTRGVCDVESQGYTVDSTSDGLTDKTLSQMAKNAKSVGKQAVIATYGREAVNLPSRISENLTVVSILSYSQLELALFHAPETVKTSSDSFELGVINIDGSVTPLR